MAIQNYGLVLQISVGQIEAITVTNGGEDYTEATVAFSSGDAEAEAVIEDGVITGITITEPGSYTTAPTITITGDGSGATATCSLFAKVGSLMNIPEVSETVDTEELTTHDSGGNKEYFPTLADHGPLDLTVIWKPEHERFRDGLKVRQQYELELTLPTGDVVIEIPKAFVSSFSLDTELSTVRKASITFVVSGGTVWHLD